MINNTLLSPAHLQLLVLCKMVRYFNAILILFVGMPNWQTTTPNMIFSVIWYLISLW